jgi:DNA-binding MarR family transcriptional regulator
VRVPTDVGSPVLEDLSASFGATFVATRRALRRSTRREVGLTPLPEAQRELLLLVAERPGITVGRAADILQLAPNTVSTLLRQLVVEGYLERLRDQDNRRVVHMVPTARATERISRFSDVRTRAFARALAQLGDEERARIEAALPALAKLAVAIEASRPPHASA